MSLPANSPTTPPSPPTLAEAVAHARWPRNRATVRLEAQHAELLRLRQAGESVGSLVGGLRALGIEIGHETLRRWLNRELGNKPPRRRRRKKEAADGFTLTA